MLQRCKNLLITNRQIEHQCLDIRKESLRQNQPTNLDISGLGVLNSSWVYFHSFSGNIINHWEQCIRKTSLGNRLLHTLLANRVCVDVCMFAVLRTCVSVMWIWQQNKPRVRPPCHCDPCVNPFPHKFCIHENSRAKSEAYCLCRPHK